MPSLFPTFSEAIDYAVEQLKLNYNIVAQVTDIQEEMGNPHWGFIITCEQTIDCEVLETYLDEILEHQTISCNVYGFGSESPLTFKVVTVGRFDTDL